MKIAVISEDRHLYELCRDALTNTRKSSWTLCALASPSGMPSADFFIWDVSPQASLPAEAQAGASKHLFLVDRQDVELFRKSSADASNILLKPVTRGTLAAFLDLAFAIAGTDTPDGTSGSGKDLQAEALLQTSIRLQKYDQERSAFLASLAHDLRSPITALLGYCGLLIDLDGDHREEDRMTILRNMQTSARRLSRMASSIFELSVEHRGVQRVDLQPGEISPCIDAAWHEVALVADDKEIAFDAKIEPFAGELYFDRVLNERVVINIFENACRLTPLKGRIEVRGYPFFWERRNANAAVPAPAERRSSVANAPNSFRVDISNSGAPIPAELLDYIFEQYTTLEPERRESGCGLGLAICRTIIAQHHGRIWAQNSGHGPVFSFVLPGGRHQNYSYAPNAAVNGNTETRTE